MANAIEDFFASLQKRGLRALRSEFQGTLRFDLTDADMVEQQWYVCLSEGQVRTTREVNPSDRSADCIVRVRREVFHRLVTGQSNVVALTLANRMTVEGELPLLLRFQQFLPDAPGAREPRSLTHRSGE